MNIFVYADESGVLDKVHERYYVFGGLIFLSKDDKNVMTRKYLKAERDIRKGRTSELKASKISNKDKGKLFRSFSVIKFGVVVNQSQVLDSIFAHKKSKQRYLDYVFKIGLKRSLLKLIEQNKIKENEVRNIYVYVDEHTTATDGKYELGESLEEELKNGTHNNKWDKFYPPLFPEMDSVCLKYCNSETVTLIRGADIVANRIYHCVNSGKIQDIQDKILLTLQP